MTVCIKLFTEKMRIAQYADNTKPASFPIIMITLVAAVQQPGAYRLADETKPILLLTWFKRFLRSDCISYLLLY